MYIRGLHILLLHSLLMRRYFLTAAIARPAAAPAGVTDRCGALMNLGLQPCDESRSSTRAQIPGVQMTDIQAIGKGMQSLVRADPDVVYDAMRVTVWGRWFLLLVVVFLTVYRPGHEYPGDLSFPPSSLLLHLLVHALMNLVPLVYNGLAHYRLLTNRPVTWRWMLGLSAMDVALTTTYVASHNGFHDFAFLGYYPALGAFAMVFSSFRFILVWVTATAVVYTLVSVMIGPGLDLGAGDEKELVARLAVMYLVPACVGLIVRLERTRRQAAMARERQAQQERIDLSQAIHDTAAQTAYMIGLGIEGAMKLASDSNPELVERLSATATLSRSAMWEVRRPIDMGLLFEGRELGHVLDSHTATFSRITSVPAEMVQFGEEPHLSAAVRNGLFSIAHNALTNAFLHSEAGSVQVKLNYETDVIRLSVFDDGVGLPEDYADRGRGFGGMETDAGRLGGRLVVESGGSSEGTAITCIVPRDSAERRD